MQCMDSRPGAIAAVLGRHGPVDLAVIETGRMSPSIALGLREFGIANKTDPHDKCWSGREDSNLRPLPPEDSALPG